MFVTFVGTEDGVFRLAGSVEPLGLSGRRISAIHAFRDRGGGVVVLAGTYGDGLFRSNDEGRGWVPITDGMTAPAARTIGPDPLNPAVILCGTEPGRLFRSGDEGRSWAELEGIRGIPGFEDWFLPYSPRAGAVRNVSAPVGSQGHLLASVEVGGLAQSHDGGRTWSIAPVGPNDDIHQVCCDPRDPSVVWCSLGWAALPSRPRGSGAPPLGGVGRSRDAGRTWEIFHHHYTRSTIVPPSHPDLVLAGPAPQVGRQGRIEVSADGGETWQPAANGIETPMPDMVELFEIAPDETVYAVCSRGRLLRSEPADWLWRSALPAGQPENVASLSFLEL